MEVKDQEDLILSLSYHTEEAELNNSLEERRLGSYEWECFLYKIRALIAGGGDTREQTKEFWEDPFA